MNKVEQEFYDFFEELSEDNFGINNSKPYITLYFYELETFTSLLGKDYFEDGNTLDIEINYDYAIIYLEKMFECFEIDWNKFKEFFNNIYTSDMFIDFLNKNGLINKNSDINV